MVSHHEEIEICTLHANILHAKMLHAKIYAKIHAKILHAKIHAKIHANIILIMILTLLRRLTLYVAVTQFTIGKLRHCYVKS